MSGNQTLPDEKSTKTKSEDDSGRVNAVQIAAATGASTTAALIAGVLGVEGTLVGVAVISLVSSVATALYLRSMNSTKKRIDKVVKSRNGTEKPLRDAVPPSEVSADTDDSDDTAAEPEPAEATPHPALAFLKRNWRTLAVTTVIVFGLSVGTLTAVAMLSGEPATAYYDSNPRPPASTTQDPDDGGDTDEKSSSSSSESSSSEKSSEESTTPSNTDKSSEPSGDEQSQDDETGSQQEGQPPTSKPARDEVSR